MVLNKSFKVLRRWRPSRSVLIESKNIPDESLLFESGTLNVLTPTEADHIRKDYPDVDSAYGCLGVLQGEGYLYLVLITGCMQTGRVGGTEVYRITKTSLIPLHANPYQHEGALEMGKLLTCGQFYFSVRGPAAEEDGAGAKLSLMSRSQRKGQDNPQFLWNRSLFVYLQRFSIDCSKWLIPIICGSVLIQTIYAGNKQVKACLVSRMSCERTGTRFNVRGLDDEGQVANFVETEQVMFVDDTVSSFVQVRGLVPTFWDQPGIQTGTNRIRLSRGFHSSHPAFERHYERLLKEYGPSLSLDLLGNRDMEPLLTEAFKEHVNELSILGATQYINFDYHSHCRPGHTEALESILLPQCEDFLERCGYYLETGGKVSKGQTGVIRHNCLDCLDRSNNAQTLMGITILRQQLEDMGVVLKQAILTRFVEQYRTFWIQNGDNISRFYAGTKALDGKSKVGKLRDGARSVQRTIKNNFLDSSKQEAIDILLLNGYVGELGWKTRALLTPIDALAPLPIRRGLCDRWLDFTKKEKLRVCIGTWNVNGGKHIRSVALKGQSLHDWLLDAPVNSQEGQEHPEEFETPADIYAIGFQELVGLTASNLVSTSSSNRHEWAAELQKVLSRDTPYSLLTAEQLVGVCLYIFVRPHLVPFIRDVAVSSVKTGIGGKAGNKGGVAIRFLLQSTSLCFVCAHFAAHQTKVVERNNDFAEICRKVQFPLGQTIDSHDYVFWCGDLNYRIDLPGSLAKDAIAKSEFDKLHRHEQLIKQKKLGRVFQGYSEGLLNFAPTFKYDMFSDDYDTSEKARIPAWCDRVLWKRKSFLPPLKHGLARLREDEDTNDLNNGEYGWHYSTVQKVNVRELSSGDPALEWWHPGRLLYYGRTELKTSDHRPVLALFEIDAFQTSEADRKKTLQEVLKDLGPPDATVVITPEDTTQTNSIDNGKLVPILQQYGQIVLVRSNDVCTLVTFAKPESALNAVNCSGEQIDNVTITVKLKQPDYYFDTEKVRILTGTHLAQLTPTNDEFQADHDSEAVLEFTEEQQDEEDLNRPVGTNQQTLRETNGEDGATLEGNNRDVDQPLEQSTEDEEGPTPVPTVVNKPNRPPRPINRPPPPSSRPPQPKLPQSPHHLEPPASSSTTQDDTTNYSSQEEDGNARDDNSSTCSSSPEIPRAVSDNKKKPRVPPSRPPPIASGRPLHQNMPPATTPMINIEPAANTTSSSHNEGSVNTVSSTSTENSERPLNKSRVPPPRPRTPPSRPPRPNEMPKRKSNSLEPHPSKPQPPKYAPKRPSKPPPKRPPPPYASLYPQEDPETRTEVSQQEPTTEAPQFSDSSLEPDPQFSDSSLDPD